MAFQRAALMGITLVGCMIVWIMVALVLLARPAHSATLADEAQKIKADEGGTLTIRIDNVAAPGGMVRLGLYDAAHYLDNDSDPAASADVPAQMGETLIVLRNVPPGVYAIETFHDVNANGKMDMNWIGLPLEPFGFSRDARPLLEKPAFSEVSFHLVAGDNSQTVHLQNSVFLFAAN